jgi:hypothetical protein
MKKEQAINFKQNNERIKAYEFIEVEIIVDKPTVNNPFTDVRVKGWFKDDDNNEIKIEGFCDDNTGRLFKIRMMPRLPGRYEYRVTYQQYDGLAVSYTGTFTAIDGGRKGLLKADKEHPYHFIWEGTQAHYYWNGTTAYYLMGWQDEQVIRDTIDRLHKLRVNRLRVLLYGRNRNRPWGKPIVETE